MARYSLSISGQQKMNDTTRYTIQVSDGTRSWVVLKRYTEVEALHKAMSYSMPGLPEMPAKSFWRRSFSGAFRDERQLKIEGLLQAMVSKDPQLTFPQLRQFFELPGSVAIAPQMAAAAGQALLAAAYDGGAQALAQPPAQATAPSMQAQAMASPMQAQAMASAPMQAQAMQGPSHAVKIAELEQRKRKAVEIEDFATAKRLQDEIEALKAAPAPAYATAQPAYATAPVQQAYARQAPQARHNDEGAPVKCGRKKCSHLFYCGRHLGRNAIPGSDGGCGPTNGPQCASCKRFQNQAQPVYAQPAQPVYAQPAQPVYAQPAQPIYAQVAQPMYGQSARIGQPMVGSGQSMGMMGIGQPMGMGMGMGMGHHGHHHGHHGMGMAVGAGVGGIAAGVVGGMMLENALERREYGYGGGGFGMMGGGGFDGGGFGDGFDGGGFGDGFDGGGFGDGFDGGGFGDGF